MPVTNIRSTWAASGNSAAGDLTFKDVSGNLIAQLENGGIAEFPGSVKFTGTQIEHGVINGPTSANGMASFVYTLKASRDAGKIILFTSGGAASRHKRVNLPLASTLTGGASGAVFRILNGHKILSSNGITIVTSAVRKLDGSSRQLKSTSRISVPGASRWGGGITITKVNNQWYTLARDFGPTMSAATARASNTWIRI